MITLKVFVILIPIIAGKPKIPAEQKIAIWSKCPMCNMPVFKYEFSNKVAAITYRSDTIFSCTFSKLDFQKLTDAYFMVRNQKFKENEKCFVMDGGSTWILYNGDTVNYSSTSTDCIFPKWFTSKLNKCLAPYFEKSEEFEKQHSISIDSIKLSDRFLKIAKCDTGDSYGLGRKFMAYLISSYSVDRDSFEIKHKIRLPTIPVWMYDSFPINSNSNTHQTHTK